MKINDFFKILYENTEAFLPGFANKIADAAIAHTKEIGYNPDGLSHFHRNIFSFQVEKMIYLENKPE